MHCELHTFFHEDCDLCHKARQAARDREVSDDSAASDLLTTVAAVEIAEEIFDSPAQTQDAAVVEVSVPDGSGFSSDTDSGGDFGGGGAGGDY
jgi:hypothetical protein